MLEAEVRLEILAIIEASGGMHRSQLCREVGRGWGTVGHHLNVLERRGLLDLERHGTRLWAFKAGTSDEERKLVRTLADPRRQELVNHLTEVEATTIRDLSDRMEESQKVLRTHLSHLMDAGLVERRGSSPHAYAVRKAQQNGIQGQPPHSLARRPRGGPSHAGAYAKGK